MNPLTGLSIGRIVVGVLSLVSPGLAAHLLFGLKPDANPQLPVLGRMFGAREIAIGAATLAASGPARRNLVIAGIGVDAADAATGITGTRKAEVGKVSGGLLTAVALGAVGSGIAALVMDRK